MRRRHASTDKKGWARFVVSRRNEASARGKTVASAPFDILNHAAGQKQERGLIAHERQVEKSNGFWPIQLAKR